MNEGGGDNRLHKTKKNFLISPLKVKLQLTDDQKTQMANFYPQIFTGPFP